MLSDEILKFYLTGAPVEPKAQSPEEVVRVMGNILPLIFAIIGQFPNKLVFDGPVSGVPLGAIHLLDIPVNESLRKQIRAGKSNRRLIENQFTALKKSFTRQDGLNFKRYMATYGRLDKALTQSVRAFWDCVDSLVPLKKSFNDPLMFDKVPDKIRKMNWLELLNEGIRRSASRTKQDLSSLDHVASMYDFIRKEVRAAFNEPKRNSAARARQLKERLSCYCPDLSWDELAVSSPRRASLDILARLTGKPSNVLSKYVQAGHNYKAIQKAWSRVKTV